MKKIYILTTLVVVFAGFAKVKVLAADPVAWYPFTGNANDAQGSLNGTVLGATLTSDRFGAANSAYNFDGLDDVIETADVATTNNVTWALTAWIKPSTLNQLGAIVTNGYDNVVDYGTGYSIHINNGNGTASGNVMAGASDGVAWYNSGGVLSAANTWYHVALVRRNDVIQMYINGVATPNSVGFGAYTPVGNVRIGGQNGGRYFAGAIDEVKIFDVGLSPEEVMEEYTASAPQITYRGSGNALQFDGSDDYVDIDGAFSAQNFTVDMWVKPGEIQNSFANIIDNNHTDSQNWVCQQEADNTNTYSFGISGTVATFQLTADVWQHLTLVKRPATIEVYVNGILISTSLLLQPLNYSAPSLRLGAWGGTGRNWNGSMDELRIWNTDLSEAEIRERICRKITPADAQYDNLISYYDFNSGNSNTLTDLKSDHDGTLQNSPTWVTSGASLGDASAYAYDGSNVSISNVQGESLTVSDFTGSPAGVHVYYVGTVPNSTNGIEGIGANDRYFGVFHFGGTGVSYTTTYHYGGNPFVNASNESGLKVYKRANNADQAWVPGGLEFTHDPVANTITIESDDSEYMLGSTSEPLPVRLASFSANVEIGGSVKLTWSTTEEVGASHFNVERSADARIFEQVGQVDAAGNTSSRQDYTLLDETPLQGTSYYRLRQVDLDGKEYLYRVATVRIEAAFSQTVYPNPAGAGILYLNFKGEPPYLTLTDLTGRKIKIAAQRSSSDLVMITSASPLAPGLYLLTATKSGQAATHHVVITEK